MIDATHCTLVLQYDAAGNVKKVSRFLAQDKFISAQKSAQMRGLKFDVVGENLSASASYTLRADFMMKCGITPNKHVVASAPKSFMMKCDADVVNFMMKLGLASTDGVTVIRRKATFLLGVK